MFENSAATDDTKCFNSEIYPRKAAFHEGGVLCGALTLVGESLADETLLAG